MSVANPAGVALRRSRTMVARHARTPVVVFIGFAAVVAAAAAATYAPVPRLFLVLVPVGLIAAIGVLASVRVAAVLLGLSIPEIQDVTGGHLGVHVAASDLVVVLIAVRLFVVAATARIPLGVGRAMRPLRLAFGPYSWLMLALLAVHFGAGSTLKSFQRVELFVLPSIVGAYLVLRGQYIAVLRAYVVAATVLAVAWPILNSHGLAGEFQKNPTGQFIAGALLLLVAVRGLRPLLPCLPLLLLGIALTASRGAVVGLGVGLVVLVVMFGARRRRAMIARAVMVVCVSAAAYPFLPGGVTSRLTNFSASGGAGSYAIDIRYQFDRDAERIISAHPWTGIGVGEYLAGSASAGTLTDDPHNVILLEAAEGGYLFAAAFIVLIGGVAYVLWRLRSLELAPAAAAIVLSTAAHGVVDVYWVRGTPVLGFVLAGMVCGLAWRRAEAQSPAGWNPAQ